MNFSIKQGDKEKHSRLSKYIGIEYYLIDKPCSILENNMKDDEWEATMDIGYKRLLCSNILRHNNWSIFLFGKIALESSNPLIYWPIAML